MANQPGDATVQAAQMSAQQYAEQANRQLDSPSDNAAFGIVGVIQDFGARADGLAAAARAGQFAVSPDLAQAMAKQFDDMIDTISLMREKSRILTTKTPLGGGYADQIGDVNAKVGQLAADLLTDFHKRVQGLRESVLKSVANYRSVDQNATNALQKPGQGA
ncbi:hypothetical protein [Solihabitans fulvus]|uniref:hypothetical protein n=1 Tax=Solihabitans fulvus TaxID=1892852 RepID=UPI001661B85B|nr:hypothetical protein [Solihabitans fulvus]